MVRSGTKHRGGWRRVVRNMIGIGTLAYDVSTTDLWEEKCDTGSLH